MINCFSFVSGKYLLHVSGHPFEYTLGNSSCGKIYSIRISKNILHRLFWTHLKRVKWRSLLSKSDDELSSIFIPIELLENKAARYLVGCRVFFEFRAFRPIHRRLPADTLISPSSSLPRSDPAALVGRSSARGPGEIYTEIKRRINCALNCDSKALTTSWSKPRSRVIHF